MKRKRIISFAMLALGVALVIFALYERGRIARAHGDISRGGSFFRDNPVSELVTGSLQSKVSSYEGPVLVCLIAGIVITVVGAGMTIACFKKSKR